MKFTFLLHCGHVLHFFQSLSNQESISVFILGRKENGNPFYNAPYQTKNIQNILLLPNIGLSKIKDIVLSSAALSIYL